MKVYRTLYQRSNEVMRGKIEMITVYILHLYPYLKIVSIII